MKRFIHQIGGKMVFIFLIILFVIGISPLDQTNAKVTDSEVFLLETQDTDILEHEQFITLKTTSSFGSSYGISYSFSTNPSCSIQVTLLPYDDLSAWQNNLPCEEHKVCTSTSKSGTVRFPHSDVWALTFWNIGYQTTTISYSAGVVELGSPASSGGGNFPWGLVIVLPIIGIACISGIIIFAIRRSRKHKIVPTFPTPSQQGYSSYHTFQPNNASLTFLMNQAVAELEQGNAVGSLAYWRQALQIDPNFYPALAGAGLCCFTLRQFDEACVYLSKAAVFNPMNREIQELLQKSMMFAEVERSLASPKEIYFKSQPSVIEVNDLEEQSVEDKSTKDTTLEDKPTTTSTESIACPYCGRALTEEVNFCPYCGNRIE